MKNNAPEQRIKNEILGWLMVQPQCMAWPNKSMGVFDPVKKIYRRDNSPYFRKGVADILGIYKGRPLAIEVKSSIGRLSPEQKIFLADFEKNGGIAIMARSLIDVIQKLSPDSILIKE